MPTAVDRHEVDRHDAGRVTPHTGKAPRGSSERRRRYWATAAGAAVRNVSPAGRYVAVLAILSAVASVIVSRYLFPHMSINNDEGIYLLHAQTLAGGHLFSAAPEPAGSFTPWLAVVDGDHYVLKYTPFVPALLAVSLLLTGGVSMMLALVTGSVVALTYLLGKEIFADRRVAAIAATLLAASPLVIVQSGLILGYLPVLVFVQAGLLCLFRGVRRGRPVLLACAGLALGTAAAVRPYDVLLLLLPPAVWAYAASRGSRWRIARWVAAGLALPVAVLLASNMAATGKLTSLPFTLLEPSDTLGFGIRRLYPTDIPHDFSPVDGIEGVGTHLWYLGAWACAGVLLVVCAVVALARRRVPAPGLAIGAGAALLLVGYIGFWGVWNAAELWGGIRYLGPFYMLPVLLPLVLLGARGLLDLALAWPRIAAPAVLVAGGLSVAILVGAIHVNMTFTRHDADLAHLLDAQPGRPLVFVGIDPPYLGHPANMVANPPDFDGRILYALSRGEADFTVIADQPGRPLYLLRITRAFNDTPDARSTGILERLQPAAGAAVELSLAIDPAPEGSRAARVVISADGRSSSYSVDPERGGRANVTITREGLSVTGLGHPLAVTEAQPGADRSITVTYHTTLEAENKERFVDRFDVPVDVPGDDSGDLPEGGASGQAGFPGPGVSVLVPTDVVGVVGEGRLPSLHVRQAGPADPDRPTTTVTRSAGWRGLPVGAVCRLARSAGWRGLPVDGASPVSCGPAGQRRGGRRGFG